MPSGTIASTLRGVASGLTAGYAGSSAPSESASTSSMAFVAPFEGAWASTLDNSTANFDGFAYPAGPLATTLANSTSDFDGRASRRYIDDQAETVVAADYNPPDEGPINIRVIPKNATSSGAFTELTEVRHDYSLREILTATSGTSTQMTMTSSALDELLSSDFTAVLLDLIIQEGLTVADVVDPTKRIALDLIESFVSSGLATSTHEASLLLASLVVLADQNDAALGLDAEETAAFTEQLAARINATSSLIDAAAAASAINLLRSSTAVLVENPQLTEALGSVLFGTSNLTELAKIESILVINGEVYAAWVINTDSGAPSEYTNFNFESMCRLNDQYYAVSADGLYRLGGQTDAGDPIMARILTGEMDFGVDELKRIEQAVIGYTAQGELVLKVTTNYRGERQEHWYKAPKCVDGELTETRVAVGKGLVSRYYQFELCNQDGADFDLDRITMWPIRLSRRI